MKFEKVLLFKLPLILEMSSLMSIVYYWLSFGFFAIIFYFFNFASIAIFKACLVNFFSSATLIYSVGDEKHFFNY